MSRTPKFRDALEILCRHQVDFVVVGGVAAVLNGAPVSTFDLEVVHSRTPDNLERLMAGLAEMEAHYRDQTGRQFLPAPALLAGNGHNLMSTNCGPVDLLGTIGKGHSFDTLLADTVSLSLGGFTIRVLSLAALIRIKQEVGRDKDQAMLAVLGRTLTEKARKP